MALPTAADVDAAVAASGSPRPKTALMNALLKNLLAYVATLGGGGGAGVWGAITGTLSSQTDLATALAGKSNTGHTHVPADVTGLGTAATRNVPASGNATGTGATAQVVTNDDTRLTNTRPPTAHTHPLSDVTGLQADLDTAMTDTINFQIDAPANGTYVLEEYAPVAMTTAKLILRLATGSLSATVTNAGANVTGLSAISPTSSQTTSTATANNSLAVGGRTTLVISGVSVSPAAASLYGTLVRNRT